MDDAFTFFSDDDLADLFQELDEQNKDVVVVSDRETEASFARYREIIRKHQDN